MYCCIPRTLGLKATTTDVIEEAGLLWDPPTGDINSSSRAGLTAICHNQRVLRSWEKVCKVRAGRTYFNGELILEVFWQAMSASHHPGGYWETRSQFHQWDWDQGIFHVFRWLGLFSLGRFSEMLILAVVILRILHNLLLCGLVSPVGHFRRAVTPAIHRRVFWTEKGFVGLGPSFMQPNDTVGVFHGGRLPLVLRPRGREWKLIGDAYVHGFMQGEVFNEAIDKTF
ncbi:hypothetical protein FGG08_002511 [Glutinoglossum americanum]|uniref:Uncharacterized protein n=1 Tax=Glutinoglossum americanum TaxID=1670608 RepID=A0A9P8L5J1_9PEZI|nr:hypothetical protein FGG08_002511 [Glutinoglossum americanum]